MKKGVKKQDTQKADEDGAADRNLPVSEPCGRPERHHREVRDEQQCTRNRQPLEEGPPTVAHTATRIAARRWG